MARLQELVSTALPLTGDDVGEQLRAANAKIAQLEVAVEHRTIIGQAVPLWTERPQ